MTATPTSPTTHPASPSQNGFVPQGTRLLTPPQPHGTRPSRDTEQLPRGRRQRRPALVAGGAVLMLLCGSGAAALVASGQDTTAVLALARDVQAGQVLTADDLRVAELSGSGLSALSVDGLNVLVGQRVTASLPAGTLLNSSMLAPDPLPVSGWQLVAVAVKPGGAPAEAVPGRDVSIVRVATAADPTGAREPAVLVAKARVVSVTTEPGNGMLILSLQVPQTAALAVTQASAAGAVAVTLLPVTG